MPCASLPQSRPRQTASSRDRQQQDTFATEPTDRALPTHMQACLGGQLRGSHRHRCALVLTMMDRQGHQLVPGGQRRTEDQGAFGVGALRRPALACLREPGHGNKLFELLDATESRHPAFRGLGHGVHIFDGHGALINNNRIINGASPTQGRLQAGAAKPYVAAALMPS